MPMFIRLRNRGKSYEPRVTHRLRDKPVYRTLDTMSDLQRSESGRTVTACVPNGNSGQRPIGKRTRSDGRICCCHRRPVGAQRLVEIEVVCWRE